MGGLKKEISADALRGDEEPAAVEAAVAGDGAEAAAERKKVERAVGVAAAELDPSVAGAVGVAAHEEIPLDAFGGIAVGLDAGGGDLAVEEKRELEGEDAGFAAAVVAAKEEASVLVVKLLVVVTVEVKDAATEGLPTVGAFGQGQDNGRGRSVGEIHEVKWSSSAGASSAEGRRAKRPRAGRGRTA